MRSRKSASRLFLGTFLEFMSCMDESESVNRVIPSEHLLGSMVQQVPCGTGGHGFNSHG